MRRDRPRAEDDRLLRLMRARAAGWTTTEIAQATGLRAETVRLFTNRVRAEDEASGEDCAGAYWPTVGGHVWRVPSPASMARLRAWLGVVS